METIRIANYEIILTGKEDGCASDTDHRVHTQFISVKQTHSDIVHHLSGNTSIGQHESIEADALIASGTVPLGTYSADCLPLALLGKENIAVVHCSWKTLHQDIIQKTVKELYRQGEDIIDISVYIGPHIRKSVYEVGEEFSEYFPTYTEKQQDGLLTFDLTGQALADLQSAGICSECIHIHKACTYTNNDRWFSRRKDRTRQRNFLGVKRLPSVPS